MGTVENRKILEINEAVKSLANGTLPESISVNNLEDGVVKELALNLNKLINNKKVKSDENFLNKEEIFRAFAKSSLDGIILISSKGSIKYWNQGASDIFGYSKDEALGKFFHELFAPQEYETLIRKKFPDFLISGKGKAVRKNHELISLKDDGTEVPVELTLSSVKIAEDWYSVAFIHDITERKEKEILEKKLLESHRMESIGTLASGIAHDFNNILALVMGYTELAIVDVEKDSTIEGELKEVYKACVRAKLLVKQIMTYTMHSEEEFIPVQINVIAKEALKLLRTTIPHSIEFKLNLENNSVVMSDPTKIHQIFMNICTNALHAMEESGGTIEVRLFNALVKDQELEGLKQGNYLVTEISDTGVGIKEENLGKIFDPYFTTKVFEKGTGLGLSVVQGIVKSCGGNIYVESTVGVGTTFSFYLPVSEMEVPETTEIPKEVNRGSENILIIDDDPSLAKLCGELVERLGYNATVYTSSIEALSLFSSKPYDFDLVVTDMNMPQMNGDILASELINIREDIPVILCTGFSRIISKEYSKSIGIKSFAMKPLSQSELSSQIRKALDSN